MASYDGHPLQEIQERHGYRVHVEEDEGTFGKRDVEGVPRLYVEVRDETGAVVYETWQNGPIETWERATLYFGKHHTDREGNDLGFSVWS